MRWKATDQEVDDKLWKKYNDTMGLAMRVYEHTVNAAFEDYEEARK